MNIKFYLSLLGVLAAAGLALAAPVRQARPAPPSSVPALATPDFTRIKAHVSTRPALPVRDLEATFQALVPAPSALPEGMRETVWKRARTAYACALRAGEIEPGAPLAVIDYDLPSSQKRLWLVDPDNPRVELHEWVSHGSGSGNLLARDFSNIMGSNQTSVGVFRAAETYHGKHGESLRLDGLEPGFNDAARQRAIVIHSAWYAEPAVIASQGRLGRSQGCPAVRPGAIDEVRSTLAGGGMLFAHASERDWLESSRFLHCA